MSHPEPVVLTTQWGATNALDAAIGEVLERGALHPVAVGQVRQTARSWPALYCEGFTGRCFGLPVVSSAKTTIDSMLEMATVSAGRSTVSSPPRRRRENGYGDFRA
jgi:hypothetical protein